jgi:hypothetical protein
MEDSLKWLPDAEGTAWEPLAAMIRNGLRVPAGYIVSAFVREEAIRAAYEDLKVREKTHFVAVRGASHAVLNVIGPDNLIHTFRRLSSESPDAVLVQRMVHGIWCGKAAWHQRNLRITANEGMMLLDPDIYLVNTETGQCIKRTLAPKQRKMIRRVDGSAKVVAREGERVPIPAEHLAHIAELAVKAGEDIGWAVDDSEKVWLISVG